MAKTIIAPIDLFTINQPIYLAEDDKEPTLINYSLLEELPEVLFVECQKTNTNKIHFFGDTNFLEPLIAKSQHLFSNIEIQVN